MVKIKHIITGCLIVPVLIFIVVYINDLILNKYNDPDLATIISVMLSQFIGLLASFYFHKVIKW